MSGRAQKLFEEATEQQVFKNDARRIRARVDEARGAPLDSGGRWPFELLQNATDAGPRAGDESVAVRFGWEPRGEGYLVWFEHNGAPFLPQDLAALLSGGSSKEYESTTTTGRFGTGFLVTHVLSLQVRLVGLLNVDENLEVFSLALDRSGNEEVLVTRRAAMKIDTAERVEDVSVLPSARFEWETLDLDAYSRGMTALADALPLVFGTAERLREVIARHPDGRTMTWTADAVENEEAEELAWRSRRVSRDIDGVVEQELRVTCVREAGVSALFLAEERDSMLTVVAPTPALARLFRRFPIRGTNNLPLEFVLEGPFTVDQERRTVLLHPADQAAIEHGLRAGSRLIRVALLQKMNDVHLLARADEPVGVASDALPWWHGALKKFAEEVARQPVVACSGTMLSPLRIDGTCWADFPRLSLLDQDREERSLFGRVWRLMKAVARCDPPDIDIAEAWTDIARGWEGLAVDVQRYSLAALGRKVAASGSAWSGLVAVEDPREWLFDFIDTVGLAWDLRKGIDTSMLVGLIPDQTGALRQPGELARDGGIPDLLKDLAEKLGHSPRRQLLHQDLDAAAAESRWSNLSKALNQLATSVRTKQQVIEDCIKTLGAKLPVTRKLGPTEKELARIAMQLVEFLWADQGPAALPLIHRIPLLMSSGECELVNAARKAMLPVSRWPERARQYSEIWPPSRILDEMWVEGGVADALVALELAYGDVLVTQRAAELGGDRLAGMLVRRDEAASIDGITVKDETFPWIALLYSEVLNRCAESDAMARQLLGFVVDYVARTTTSWRDERTVVGVRKQERVQLRLRDALWLGDLRGRSWVPSLDGQNAAIKLRASAESLRELLNPDWLVDNPNGILMLTDCFGADRLELQLLGVPSGPPRNAMREQLARIVGAASGNAVIVRETIAALEARREQGEQARLLRCYGLAVQAAIAGCLERRGFGSKRLDRGFDYVVRAGESDSLQDIDLLNISPSDWLIEVKATTGDVVELTPLQARTAGKRPQQWVLCVVPFAQLSDALVEPSALAARVEEVARIVLDVGPRAAATVALVEQAARSAVGLRNEDHLRYSVNRRFWEQGLTIDAWIEQIAGARSEAPA